MEGRRGRLRQGTYGILSEQRRLAREEARKETRKEDLLRVFEVRKIVVDAYSRERIISCGDMETIDDWFDRSVAVTEIGELFRD